jgi:hypothetical protein
MIASVVPYDQRNYAPDAESRRRYCVWSGQGWKDEVSATWPVRMDDRYTYAMCSDDLIERRNDGLHPGAYLFGRAVKNRHVPRPRRY